MSNRMKVKALTIAIANRSRDTIKHENIVLKFNDPIKMNENVWLTKQESF